MRAHLQYLSYVLRHKWFVFVAGLRVGAPLWRLVIHDWSKFAPAEWGAYVAAFYKPKARGYPIDMQVQFGAPSEGEAARINEQRAEDFDRAWLHHQHANPHHWQHWMLREDSGAVKLIEMPYPLAREMVADWMGAGRAITGRWEVAEWYTKNREVIQLHPKTRRYVEDVLGVHAGYRPLQKVA